MIRLGTLTKKQFIGFTNVRVDNCRQSVHNTPFAQYPYGGEMDAESKGGYMEDLDDLPTERTDVSPPPEYTPPEDPPTVNPYSVMQSDGNSWKIDTFRGAITSDLMISC